MATSIDIIPHSRQFKEWSNLTAIETSWPWAYEEIPVLRNKNDCSKGAKSLWRAHKQRSASKWTKSKSFPHTRHPFCQNWYPLNLHGLHGLPDHIQKSNIVQRESSQGVAATMCEGERKDKSKINDCDAQRWEQVVQFVESMKRTQSNTIEIEVVVMVKTMTLQDLWFWETDFCAYVPKAKLMRDGN